MKKNSLVLYKNKPAIIKDFEGEKIIIDLAAETKKIREKDVCFLSEEVSSLDSVLNASLPDSDLEEGIILLEGDKHSFSSIVSLLWPALPSPAYYKAWNFISTSPFFIVGATPESLIAIRSQEEIKEMKRKEDEKKAIAEKEEAFLALLKKIISSKQNTNVDLNEFSVFFQDIEEVALCKKEKPKWGKPISPETAHGILLKTSYWSILKDPYPYRYKKIIGQAKKKLVPNIKENYVDLTYMNCYAIDGESTTDPDDAISYDGKYLWIHIALVADNIEFGDEIDDVLLKRGRTLYLPEGTHYMLGKEETSSFAIGLQNQSYALSFKLKLNDDASIESVEVMRGKIKCERLTYKQASEQKNSEELKYFFEIAKANFAKRCNMGAINIEIGDVSVKVKDEKVFIEPQVEDDAFRMIKEMMLLVGEATAFFAFKNGIPFQYISQSVNPLPNNLETGLAGEFKKRKCMKSRNISTHPAAHSGLGLSMYCQITSPLRRYDDLVVQKQILNYIDKLPYIPTDELLAKLAMGDMAHKDSQNAERMAKRHFVIVYLIQNPNWVGEATIISCQDTKAYVYIHSIGVETSIHLKQKVALNDKIQVKVLEVDLPKLEMSFIEV
ncbi:MAG: ribonuclease catalytic domain-containing protein [Treponema sp.]